MSWVRIASFVATLGVAQPCLADSLSPDTVRTFVIGRHFAFHCFEGTQGSGRIYSDGSVAGTIQLRGVGEPRYVTLPAGTLLVKGQNYCASLPRLGFQPCFDVDRTSAQSFRGSLAGVGSLFCDFTKRDDRPRMVRQAPRFHSSRPLQLMPAHLAARRSN